MRVEFEPGRPVRVAPGVQRLVAPNASAMTGPGTNTYLIGDPPTMVLDPGPDDPAHVAAILAHAPGLARVVVTHTHADHSPAARSLAARTGAELIGQPGPPDGRQDQYFKPHRIPIRDARLGGGDEQLIAIDTPGHASNHFCYLLARVGMLFSGDHILDGVTPVILAPDGNMAQYLDSLTRLKNYALMAIAPGHGRILEEPYAVIDGIVAHRRAREAKVLAALARDGASTFEALLAAVYDDVHPELHKWARYTLEAHLFKLEHEGRCARKGETWRT